MSLAILVIEDHTADALRDTLEAEGWHVRTCADAETGRGEIECAAHYDALIIDNQLPGGASGVELIRWARSLSHRRHTPVLMFSGSYAEGEAKAAGADLFLRKPQDLGVIVETVKGLTQRWRGGGETRCRGTPA